MRPRRLNLHVLTSVFALALAPAALAGPELDRARRATAAARSVLDAAERKLRSAEAEEDRLGREVDRLRDRRRDAERRVDDLRDEQRELPRRVSDLEDKFPLLNKQLDDAKRDLERDLKPLKDAIAAERAAATKVRDQRSIYQRLFEMSQAYVEAEAAAKDAVMHEKEVTQAVKARLHATSEYQAAIKEYNTARARLDALKADPSAPLADRAKAATAVIETEKVTTRMESDADGSDPELAQARTDQRKTEAAFKTLVAAFEANLPKEPVMAAAIREHEAAVRESNRVEAMAKRSQDQVRSLTQKIDATKGEIRTLKARIDDFDKLIAAAKRDVDQIVTALDQTQRAESAVAADIPRFRRDVDFARRRYDDARRFEIVAAQRDAENEKKKEKQK